MKKKYSLNRSVLFASGVLLTFVQSLSLQADELIFQQGNAPDATYSGSESSWIRSDDLAANDDGPRLILGSTGSAQLNGLLSFDVSAIPSGASIDSVSLSLFYNAPSDGLSGVYTLYVHELTQAFVENEATWAEYSTGNAWASSGGDYDGTILSSASDNPVNAVKFDELIFASSLSFVNVVQDAIDGVGTADFLIKMSEADLLDNTDRKVFDFFSDDNNVAGIAYRPELTVSYTVPEPSSVALLLGVGVICFTSAIRRRKH